VVVSCSHWKDSTQSCNRLGRVVGTSLPLVSIFFFLEPFKQTTRSWLNLKSPARANPLRSDATHSPQLPSCMPSQREGAEACGPSIVFPRRMQATAGLDWGVCKGLPGTKCVWLGGGLPAQVGAVRGSDPCVRFQVARTAAEVHPRPSGRCSPGGMEAKGMDNWVDRKDLTHETSAVQSRGSQPVKTST
jgi:hypothetical protein